MDVTTCSIKALADVIRFRLLRWREEPALSRRVLHVIARVLLKRGARRPEKETGGVTTETSSYSDARKGSRHKNAGGPQKLKRRGHRFSRRSQPC